MPLTLPDGLLPRDPVEVIDRLNETAGLIQSSWRQARLEVGWSEALDDVYCLCLDTSAESALLGHPILGEIASTVCRLLASRAEWSDGLWRLLDTHVAALGAVIAGLAQNGGRAQAA